MKQNLPLVRFKPGDRLESIRNIPQSFLFVHHVGGRVDLSKLFAVGDMVNFANMEYYVCSVDMENDHWSGASQYISIEREFETHDKHPSHMRNDDYLLALDSEKEKEPIGAISSLEL